MTHPRSISITAPDLGTPQAVFSLWYVCPGDRVYEGDRVAEVLIPGATVDVAAPTTGTLAARHARPNDPVSAGQVLGSIQEE